MNLILSAAPCCLYGRIAFVQCCPMKSWNQVASLKYRALRSPRPANTGLRNGARRKLEWHDWISLSRTVHSRHLHFLLQCNVLILQEHSQLGLMSSEAAFTRQRTAIFRFQSRISFFIFVRLHDQSWSEVVSVCIVFSRLHGSKGSAKVRHVPSVVVEAPITLKE